MATDDTTSNRWWHALVFSAAASAGTFVASHWGGVTNDGLDEKLRTQKVEIVKEVTKLVNEADAKEAKDVDDLRRYVDTKAKAIPVAVKKKHRTTEHGE